ncbi:MULTISPECIES: hypothetical protein [unclassified Sphingomonas]|jgi:hypothetical protein|uniref:hypothetical protein n=1 Tax=unclassified Sphingomonas TaxID=196159 RepID=UPI000E103804|nr:MULTISPECIES: hypothetical protein [unclassified Sphingomonas]AXJ96664.1 hypothetical protein DM480_15390 [Sphingomonas sp. FARSPH]
MTQPSDGAPSGPLPTLFEAIVRLRVVTATYNKGVVTMAPHILYTRHGEVYVDAITLDRDGKPPREEKMGAFKLDGLGDPTIVQDRPFFPNPLYDPAQEKYAGVTLLAVERA